MVQRCSLRIQNDQARFADVYQLSEMGVAEGDRHKVTDGKVKRFKGLREGQRIKEAKTSKMEQNRRKGREFVGLMRNVTTRGVDCT